MIKLFGNNLFDKELITPTGKTLKIIGITEEQYYEYQKLQQENQQLKEKVEYLKKQKENKNKWFQLIADIGFDYDGYNDVENLKSLVDELVKYALNGRDNYEYEDIFEELENGE